ncbi:hypothetical protein TSUD_130730 [Trifolium subterraneum]|nr:hypothetical protein TSUD_130730 [Trifolium subterraneum]
MPDLNIEIIEKEQKEEKEEEFKTNHDSLSTSLCPKQPPTTQFPSNLQSSDPPLKPPDPPPKPPDLPMVYTAQSPPAPPPEPPDLKSLSDEVLASPPCSKPPSPSTPFTNPVARPPAKPPYLRTFMETPITKPSLKVSYLPPTSLPPPKPPDTPPPFSPIVLLCSTLFDTFVLKEVFDFLCLKGGPQTQSSPSDSFVVVLGKSHPSTEITIRVLYQLSITNRHVDSNSSVYSVLVLSQHSTHYCSCQRQNVSLEPSDAITPFRRTSPLFSYTNVASCLL